MTDPITQVPATTSIRAFVGARNFQTSRDFYLRLGFEEVSLGDMSYFKVNDRLGFYLQDAYVKQWVDNTMLFLEVPNPEEWLASLNNLKLEKDFPGVRISKMVINDWGREFFLHDPSGVLWHIGCFGK
jgi:hypothetical protein